MGSIFDQDSPFDPTDWLREKTLAALCEAVSLVDLANEKDTTPWYARRLREHASRLVGRLAPIVVLVYGASGDAAHHEQWQPIVERGSFALAAWCKRWRIKNPHDLGIDFAANEVDPDEAAEKAEEPDEAISCEEEAAAFGALSVYGTITRRMIHAELSDPARRLMLWLLSHLAMSGTADVVDVSRRFLPTDIGCDVDATLAAYRELYDGSFVQRVDNTDGEGTADRLRLRLLTGAGSGSKHPQPYRDETFGFPGARVDGKVTWGNKCMVPVPASLADAGARWCRSDADLAALRIALQDGCGDDRAYIETVRFTRREQQAPFLDVSYRSPIEENDDTLVVRMAVAAEQWLRARVVGS